MIRVALEIEFNKHGTCVSWLPQYHDMGLIGSVITTFYTNYTGIYISPLTFIKNPILLLELCSQYRCTHLQTPHFIFPLIMRRWNNLDKREKEERLNLDLSSLYHIFNAAQPINPDEYLEFYNLFKSYGLKKEALATGYGLAESVVYVCDTGHNGLRGGKIISIDKDELKNNKIKLVESTHPNSKRLIGCGYPPDKFDVDIYIDNKSKEELAIGEILVSSPSVADYLNHSEKIKLNDKSYIPTGDLGFIYNKELFYCGRIKEMINLKGENHYPQDIEWTIQQNSNVRKGSLAVFNNNEELYLVIEFKNYQIIEHSIKDIKARVSLEHGLKFTEIIVLTPKNIPKTTSGKICRLKTKKLYFENKLKSIFQLL